MQTVTTETEFNNMLMKPTRRHPIDESNKMALQYIVNHQLFHQVKFITHDSELVYSEDPGTICHYVMTKMENLPRDKESWWKEYSDYVHIMLGRKRNNLHEVLKTGLISKWKIVMVFSCEIITHGDVH